MKNTINGQKLEFGNSEQIKWLKGQEAWLEEMIAGEAEVLSDKVSVNVEVEIEFPCVVCASNVSVQETDYDANPRDQIEDLFYCKTFRCRSCGSKYQIHYNAISLIENSKNPKAVTKEAQP